MNGAVFVSLGIVSVAIAGNLFFQRRTLLRVIRNRRLRRVGVEATAEITAISDTGSRFNGQPVARIGLIVSSATTGPFQASTTAVVTAINATQFAPGRLLRVKYDPARPSEVVVVGPPT